MRKGAGVEWESEILIMGSHVRSMHCVIRRMQGIIFGFEITMIRDRKTSSNGRAWHIDLCIPFLPRLTACLRRTSVILGRDSTRGN